MFGSILRLSLAKCPLKSSCQLSRSLSTRTLCTKANGYDYENITVSKPREWVFNVEFNRPEKRNAINHALINDVVSSLRRLSYDPDCRVVVLSGSGLAFTSGVDLNTFAGFNAETGDLEISRRAFAFRRIIEEFQEGCNAFEKCRKPVIAAVHGPCIGFGIDIISACDMRYCTKDASFSVKEVDIGLAADVGTLQRLPKIIGNQSLVRELVFTARSIPSDEVLHIGLVSRVFNDKEQLMKGALDVASVIASKSPIAVQTTKRSLLYSRDHSVQDGLDNIATWNQVMLQSEDIIKSVSEKKPVFTKL
ncbi:delta(3,5)-Delta(2,4)-dienoyl-CoA isomerase, mitochondrial-like isoform X1 [Argonauta hians]